MIEWASLKIKSKRCELSSRRKRLRGSSIRTMLDVKMKRSKSSTQMSNWLKISFKKR